MLSIQKRLSPGRARAMGTCRTMPKKAKACPEPLRGPPAPGPSPPQRDRWCLAERANQGPGERARPTGSQWVSVAERWLYGREPIAAGGAGPRARREAQVRGVRRRPAGHPLPCGASPVSAHLPGRWAEAGTQTLTYGGPRRRDDDHGVRACTHLVAPLLASRQPATEVKLPSASQAVLGGGATGSAPRLHAPARHAGRAQVPEEGGMQALVVLDGVASTQLGVRVRVGCRQPGHRLGMSESVGVCRRSGGRRWGPA